MRLETKQVRVGVRKYDLRFVYFESRPTLNPTGACFYNRKVKLWWKPIYWLGNKSWFRYLFGHKWTWWVRNYMTFD